MRSSASLIAAFWAAIGASASGVIPRSDCGPPSCHEYPHHGWVPTPQPAPYSWDMIDHNQPNKVYSKVLFEFIGNEIAFDIERPNGCKDEVKICHEKTFFEEIEISVSTEPSFENCRRYNINDGYCQPYGDKYRCHVPYGEVPNLCPNRQHGNFIFIKIRTVIKTREERIELVTRPQENKVPYKCSECPQNCPKKEHHRGCKHCPRDDNNCQKECKETFVFFEKECERECPKGDRECRDRCSKNRECRHRCPKDDRRCHDRCPKFELHHRNCNHCPRDDNVCLEECKEVFVFFEKECERECPKNDRECRDRCYKNRECRHRCPKDDRRCHDRCPKFELHPRNCNHCPRDDNVCLKECKETFVFFEKECERECPKGDHECRNRCCKNRECRHRCPKEDRHCHDRCPKWERPHDCKHCKRNDQQCQDKCKETFVFFQKECEKNCPPNDQQCRDRCQKECQCKQNCPPHDTQCKEKCKEVFVFFEKECEKNCPPNDHQCRDRCHKEHQCKQKCPPHDQQCQEKCKEVFVFFEKECEQKCPPNDHHCRDTCCKQNECKNRCPKDDHQCQQKCKETFVFFEKECQQSCPPNDHQCQNRCHECRQKCSPHDQQCKEKCKEVFVFFEKECEQKCPPNDHHCRDTCCKQNECKHRCPKDDHQCQQKCKETFVFFEKECQQKCASNDNNCLNFCHINCQQCPTHDYGCHEGCHKHPHHPHHPYQPRGLNYECEGVFVKAYGTSSNSHPFHELSCREDGYYNRYPRKDLEVSVRSPIQVNHKCFGHFEVKIDKMGRETFIFVEIDIEDSQYFVTEVAVFVECEDGIRNGNQDICKPETYPHRQHDDKGLEHFKFEILDEFQCRGDYFIAVYVLVCVAEDNCHWKKF